MGAQGRACGRALGRRLAERAAARGWGRAVMPRSLRPAEGRGIRCRLSPYFVTLDLVPFNVHIAAMKSAAIDVTTFSEARANLKSVMDKVVEDHVPMIISRRKAEPVVMISLSEWNSWQETMYLNSTAANRKALDEAMAQADAGDLIETEFGEDGNLHPVRQD